MAMIRRSLPVRDRELADELEQLWIARRHEFGRGQANRWLARQALAFAVSVLPARCIPDRESLESAASDLRIAARALRRAPAFTTTFVLTLALAMGVVATVYGAAHWMLLRPVPGVRAADQLITMRLGMTGQRASHSSWSISQPDLVTLRQRMTAVSDLAAMTSAYVDVQERGAAPRRVAAEMVTTNYFRVLGARVLAGHGFDDDDAAGEPVAAILSYQLASAMAADPTAVIGSDLRVNGALLRVIGVMEPDFRGAELPGLALIWLPPSASSIVDPSTRPDARADRMFGMWQRMIGREAIGSTPRLVEAEANGVMAAVRREFSRHSYASALLTFQVYPGAGLDPAVRISARHTLALLVGAAAFLLCLATANLTNLALVHTLRRGDATAMRIALGASRMRVTQGLLAEGILLGMAGAGAATLIVVAGCRWLASAQLSEFGASLRGVHVDAHVLVFVMAMSFVVTLLSYVWPALTRQRHVMARLMGRAVVGRGVHGLRSALAGLQVTLSVVLVIAAMLLEHTVANLSRVDLGFLPQHLLTIRAAPKLHGYDAHKIDLLGRALEDRLRDTPELTGVGIVSPAPLRSTYIIGWLQRRPGDTERHEDVTGANYFVTPGFLNALGVRFLAGDRDWRADSGTVVITATMLRELLPGTSPASAIGHVVYGPDDVPLRIAAVTADVRLSDLTREPLPTSFRPLREGSLDEPIVIYLRSAATLSTGVATVTHAMAGIAPDIPLYDPRSAREDVDLQFAAQRVMANVAAALGVLGITLAAVGLYGVLASIVAAEQKEFAIRAALGAGSTEIVRSVLARGLTPAVVGMVVGVAGAALVSRLFSSLLFGVATLDSMAYGWGLAAAAGSCLLASLPPAFRAAHVPIVRLLRAE
jgi:predicted permease